MKRSEKIGLLMYRFMRNELSPKEMKELSAWRNQSPKHETAFQEATDWDNVRTDLQWSENNSTAILEKIKAKYPGPWRTEEKKPKVKVRLMTRFLRAAAIWIPLLIWIGYRYSINENATPHPGTYAGMMDGSSNDFTVPIIHDFIRGYKAGFANLKIVEPENGILEYIATNEPEHLNRMYDVRTYNGNAFVLRLPGIANIWVNASTTLWYPAKFDTDTLRIKLTGEAYFEMEANKPVAVEVLPTANSQPPTFIRESGSFNVHAYPSDSLIVSRDAQSVAWKNRKIFYPDASLKTILDEIARWYDVDVHYGEGSEPDKKYHINLPRDAAFSEVIRVLNEQGAKLYVSRNSIYVM